MGILNGKRLLITGVLTDASLAFSIAGLAQEEGAELVLTGAGRGLSLTRRTARKLPQEPEVLEFDVTSAEDAESLRAHLADKWDRVDGALHAIGFAPEVCLGEDFMAAGWDDVAVTMQISAYSLKTVAEVVVPLMTEGGSIVGLDFDARFAWPAYNWMGVAKAALESPSRSLAAPSARTASESTWWRQGRSGRWRPGASRASGSSRPHGRAGRPWAGTYTTPIQWRGHVWRCSRTGSPQPPAR